MIISGTSCISYLFQLAVFGWRSFFFNHRVRVSFHFMQKPRLIDSPWSSCQHLENNRLLISSTGQCTPVEDEGSANQHREGPPLHRTLQGRRMSSGRLALGRFKGTLEDKMLDGFLWLQNQGKSKHINAEKVLISNLVQNPISRMSE